MLLICGEQCNGLQSYTTSLGIPKLGNPKYGLPPRWHLESFSDLAPKKLDHRQVCPWAFSNTDQRRTVSRIRGMQEILFDPAVAIRVCGWLDYNPRPGPFSARQSNTRVARHLSTKYLPYHHGNNKVKVKLWLISRCCQTRPSRILTSSHWWRRSVIWWTCHRIRTVVWIYGHYPGRVGLSRWSNHTDTALRYRCFRRIRLWAMTML